MMTCRIVNADSDRPSIMDAASFRSGNARAAAARRTSRKIVHGPPPVRPLDIGGAVTRQNRALQGHSMTADLAKTIDDAFEKRADITPATKGPVRDAVETALDLLDRGKARVAERGGNGAWSVNQWLKKAVLLSFRLERQRARSPAAAGSSTWWDKVPSKFDGWDANRFQARPASAPCRAAWCAAPPTSRRTSC